MDKQIQSWFYTPPEDKRVVFAKYTDENHRKRLADFSLDTAKFRELCEKDCAKECPFSDNFDGPVFARLSLAFVKYEPSEISELMDGWLKFSQLAWKFQVHNLDSGRHKRVNPWFEIERVQSESDKPAKLKRFKLDPDSQSEDLVKFTITGELTLSETAFVWLMKEARGGIATFSQADDILAKNCETLGSINPFPNPRLKCVKFSVVPSTIDKRVMWSKIGTKFRLFQNLTDEIELMATGQCYYFTRYWANCNLLFIHSLVSNIQIAKVFRDSVDFRILTLRFGFLSPSNLPELLSLFDWFESEQRHMVIVFLAPDPELCMNQLIRIIGTEKLFALKYTMLAIKQVLYQSTPIYSDVVPSEIRSDLTTVFIFDQKAATSSQVNTCIKLGFSRFKLVIYRRELTVPCLESSFNCDLDAPVIFGITALNNRHLPIQNKLSRIIERFVFASNIRNPNLFIDFGLAMNSDKFSIPSERHYNIYTIDPFVSATPEIMPELNFDVFDFI